MKKGSNIQRSRTYRLGLRCPRCGRHRTDQSPGYCYSCRELPSSALMTMAQTSEWFDDCQGVPTRRHGDLQQENSLSPIVSGNTTE